MFVMKRQVFSPSELAGSTRAERLHGLLRGFVFVKRLNFLDASFVHLESNQTPMHVAALLQFRPPEGAPRDFVRRLYEHLRSFPVSAAPFNLRLSNSLLSRLAPGVEEAHDIDLDYHLRHSALPNPGSERQLGELIARLHSQRLVRSRPLWECHLIEGLEDDRFAVYLKLHHALVDGMRAVGLVQNWLSEDPSDRNTPPPWAAPAPQRRSRATRGASKGILEPLETAASVVRFIADSVASDRGATAGIGAMLRTPRSQLNGPITGQRRFATQSLPIDRLRAVARSADATVNDVALALCGAVLRRYLGSRCALPIRSLVCMVPVGLQLQEGSGGNAVSFLMVPLGTDRESERERLELVTRATRHEKQRLQSLSRPAVDLYTTVLAAPVSILQLAGLADRVPPLFNVVVSNVRVHAERLHLHGAELTGVYPVSLVVEGQALNITLVGYADGLHFGFTACRDAVPHVQRLAVSLPEELTQLEHAFGLGPSEGPRRRRAVRA